MNKKNIKAIIEAGEVEKYTKEYFQQQGRKSWDKLTSQEQKEKLIKMRNNNKKFNP